MKEGETHEDVITDVGFEQRELEQYRREWGYRSRNHWAEIREKIEQILQWK